ncbi:MAG: RuBisCO accumulation factor 1 [Cyanobacteriota bacterium]|jgi:hypothetical protein
MPDSLTPDQAQVLLQSLLQKEGSWVDWGQKCQRLQQGGYSAEAIFEATGFQKVQQNLVIVASQVYESLVRGGAGEEILEYYLGPKSDILYELRILNQDQRVSVAQTAQSHRLEAEDAKELARAVQEISRLSQLPAGFTACPGDALAYQCWRRAKQKRDLPERARLIAKGLKFAASPGARQSLEGLLLEFTASGAATPAPLLPLYRLEQDEEAARLIPVAGTLPLTPEQITQVPQLTPLDPFGVVTAPENCALAPIPGWQAILTAVDPVAFVALAQDVALGTPQPQEPVLVVIDRGQTVWNPQSYFLVSQHEQVAIHWSGEPLTVPILGQVILVLRPKRILDENNLREPWQMDD